MIRLMIVDDHAIVRKGLKQIFALVPEITVVAEASDGSSALSRLHDEPADIVLLDMTMPGISGNDLISRIHRHYPKIPILVLSMHNEPQIVQKALHAGASGYLSKDNEPELLITAVRKIASGGRFIDPQIAEHAMFYSLRANVAEPHEHLSERELQILCRLAKGLSGNEIAAELAISNKTVSTHKTKLMEKMGFESTADIIRYAMEHHLGH